MALHNERVLQNELVRELKMRGWLEATKKPGQPGDGAKSAGKYDLKHALYPEDVLSWIKATEAGEYAKVKAMHNGETDEKLLKRLVDVLEKDGTIAVLREGFSYLNAHFPMCAFPPNSGLNPHEATRYKQNILRIVQELEYSESNGRRIDLAFFLNGIPVATMEMKTENTQTIDDAIKQYCTDRPPKDEKTKKAEPLLTWKRGAIVHFAVSSREVFMTTRLDGAKSVFLPFNRGNNGGKGNPPDSGVNYLWEEILQRDAWMDILANFVCIETRKKTEAGKIVRKGTLLFPRYHQWDAVTKLIVAAKAEGPGQKYLVQHSAGSGKSNTIMWLAHRLANLHDDKDKKIFDTVFVVTDRQNLDEQLAETIKQFDNKAGLIAKIGDDSGSKNQQLKAALEGGKPIIIVTLQTFPVLLQELQGKATWSQRSFALIADEAHSSQSGKTAKNVRAALGLSSDDGDITTDDQAAATFAKSKNKNNISYFAFTATPKKRTVELFGCKGPDGKPVPFHIYTMRQAIEEGFILDVLKNYITYKMLYQLATSRGETVVPKSDAAKVIARYAHLISIQQKIPIIVAHFRDIVSKELNGHGKAMIVTDSREAAARYKLLMDKYLADQGFTDIKTLVAFSGRLKIRELPDEFTESSLNSISEDIPEAFDSDDYQVLIVAEKYQTGFDQPKLCGMYVDKKLDGLPAVQTLSRLNRTYNGPFGTKKVVYIVDFVNTPDRIKDAFLPYFEGAEIDTPTDPNIVYDLQRTIDAFGVPGIYSAEDVDAFFAEHRKQYISKKPSQTALNNLVTPSAERYVTRLRNATKDGDSEIVEASLIFRKNLGTFLSFYRFLSQIYDFESDDLAKRELFFEWLLRLIREKQTGESLDISSVQLTHLAFKKESDGSIILAGKKPLRGGEDAGSKVARAKDYGTLQEVIDLMNEFFGGHLSEDNRVTMILGVFERAIADEKIAAQAKSNTLEKFELGGIKDEIKRYLTETYTDEIGKHTEDTKQLGEIRTVLSEEEKSEQFATTMARAVYKAIKNGQKPAP